jgi:hypothetical protein
MHNFPDELEMTRCVFCFHTMQLFGYRLYAVDLFNSSQKALSDLNGTRYITEKSLEELGGVAGGPVEHPFVLKGVDVLGFSHFGVVGYNLNGESNLVVLVVIPDSIPPQTKATNVEQTPDINVESGVVSVKVSFKRAHDEEVSPGTLGYRLYAGSHNVLRTFIEEKTLGQLGGSPGTEVANPFVVLHWEPQANHTEWYVVAYKDFDAVHFSSTPLRDEEGLGYFLELLVTACTAGCLFVVIYVSSTKTALSSWERSIAPLSMLLYLQDISMISKLQLPTLPITLRSFGRAINWSNFSWQLVHTIYGNADESLGNAAIHIQVVTNGISLSTYFYDVLIITTVVVISALVYIAISPKQKHPSHKDASKDKVKTESSMLAPWWMALNAMIAITFGLMTASLVELLAWNNQPQMTGPFALAAIGVIVITAPLVCKVVRSSPGKPSLGVYRVISFVRRLVFAAVIGLLIKNDYMQCWIIVGLSLLQVAMIVYLKPFSGE